MFEWSVELARAKLNHGPPTRNCYLQLAVHSLPIYSYHLVHLDRKSIMKKQCNITSPWYAFKLHNGNTIDAFTSLMHDDNDYLFKTIFQILLVFPNYGNPMVRKHTGFPPSSPNQGLMLINWRCVFLWRDKFDLFDCIILDVIHLAAYPASCMSS